VPLDVSVRGSLREDPRREFFNRVYASAQCHELENVQARYVAARSATSRERGTTANLAAMRKVDSWAQGEFVEKGGWATVPGANPPDQVSAVAKACAQLLSSTWSDRFRFDPFHPKRADASVGGAVNV
jgi:hypothetical protein